MEIRFHTVMPRNPPERRIEITKEPNPSKGAGWWNVSMFIRNGEAEIKLEITDEAMTAKGVRSRAEELARSKAIEDVFDF